MVFYFTATGNSLYVAKKLSENPISIPQALKNNELNFTDDTIGIVSPVYSGELPVIVQEFLKKVSLNAKYIYVVLTYGNDETVSAKWSKDFASKCGINVDFIATVKMVDNYLPVFDMNEQKKIDKNVDGQLSAVISDINTHRIHIPKASLKSKMLYKFVKKMHTDHPEMINGTTLKIKDNCIGCGICVKICPRGILTIENSKAIRTQTTCEFCLSCVNNCPKKAIGFTSQEKNADARYRNENITLEEIIKANNQQ